MSVPIALFGVWLAAGIGGAIITFRVLTRPLTDTDLYCPAVDNELNAREVPWTADIAANLAEHAPDEQDRSRQWEDYIDEREQQRMDREFVADIEAWLRARERYEGAS